MDGLPKGIFFDLYGTLLVFDDFDNADNNWTKVFYELGGKPNNISFEDIKLICNEILESDLEKDISTGLTTYETKIKNGFAQKNIFPSDEEIKIIADATLEVWQRDIRPAKDAMFVLGELRKSKKIVLITNFDHSPHIKKLITKTGLAEYFDEVIISDEAGCKKPSPDIFNIALEKIGLKKEEVVYVGDNIVDDIGGASSAGIKPVLISRNSKSNNVNHLYIDETTKSFQTISSLSELLDLFN
jgi:putative hydrolase of the HAD superfamily